MVTGYDRVRLALAGRCPDRVPLGEFRLAPSLVAGLLGKGEGETPAEGPARWRLEGEALRVLGADAVGVVVGQGGALSVGVDAGSGWEWSGQTWCEEVAYWAGRDPFVWAVIDGPWQGLTAALGWHATLLLVSGRSTPGIAERCDRVADPGGPLLLQLDRVLAEVRRALETGADGIVLGEDVAYAWGLFLPPSVITERLWPLWREVTRYCSGARTARGDKPLVCFHSDGSFEGLLPAIQEAGFDAVHSLEPEAGMDAARLVGLYRGQLGLWGGLSVDLLVRGSPGEVAGEGERLARAGRTGGLMVGTCSGVVPKEVPVVSLLAAYRAVTAVGASDRRAGEADMHAGS